MVHLPFLVICVADVTLLYTARAIYILMLFRQVKFLILFTVSQNIPDV